MDFGAPELIIILIVVLLIFGPGRIASLGHELGASIRQFRQGLDTPSESNKAKEEKLDKQ
jgi:sec-independent protein translocase protein TatA